MLGIICVGLIAAAWLLAVLRCRARGIPGPLPFPLLGHLPLFLWAGDYTSFMKPLHARYGPAVFLDLVAQKWVLLGDPEMATALYRTNTTRAFLVGGSTPERYGLQAAPLFNLTGAHWKRNRKHIRPMFDPVCVQQTRALIVDPCASALVEALRPFARSGAAFDIQPVIRRAVFDVACEMTCGLRLPVGDKDAVTQAFTCVVTHILKDIELPVRTWFKSAELDRAVALLRTLLMRQVDDYLALPREALLERADLLARLVLAQEGDLQLSREEIYAELFQYLFAGYDTSTASLGYFMMVMAEHPEAQRRVREEGEPFLLACIKEAMRLHPVSPVLDRLVVTEEVDCGGGVVLRKGEVAALSIHALHRHVPTWGADAEEFVPDRFLRELTPAQRSAYVPFGSGPKLCVGYQLGQAIMQSMAAAVLGAFSLEAAPGFELHYEDSFIVSARTVDVLLRVS